MGEVVSGYKQNYGGKYEQQKRANKTIKTHNDVTVPASGTAYSEWIDLEGYEAIAVTYLNDAATQNTGTFEWSHDGQNKFVGVATLAGATSKERVGTSPVYAKYFRLALLNGDTASHKMTAYVYARA